MPKGFNNYVVSSGYLSILDGTDLSVKKANEFLDFIVTDTFNDIMRQIRRDMGN